MNYRRIGNPDRQIKVSILTKDTSQAEDLCKNQTINLVQDLDPSLVINPVPDLDQNQAQDLLIQDPIQNQVHGQARDHLQSQALDQAADRQIPDQAAGLQIQDQVQDPRQGDNLHHDQAI